jgi:hypothetical protein
MFSSVIIAALVWHGIDSERFSFDLIDFAPVPILRDFKGEICVSHPSQKARRMGHPSIGDRGMKDVSAKQAVKKSLLRIGGSPQRLKPDPF